jgi:Haem-binding domain
MLIRIAAPTRRRIGALVVAASVAISFTGGCLVDKAPKTAAEAPLLMASRVPVPVAAILQRACKDCHSDNTHWPWYAHVPPVSWKIRHDVSTARAFMNLSKWNEYTEREQQGFAASIGEAVESHVMPPAGYVCFHSQARLSPSEVALIQAWAAGKLDESPNRPPPSQEHHPNDP